MNNETFAETKLTEAQNKRIKKTKTKKSKKGLVAAILALIMAGIVAVSCFIGFRKKNNNKENSNPTTTTTTTTVSVDDLGMEEDLPKVENNDKVFGDTTGDIKKEDLVVDKDGTIWKDKAASDKKGDVGKVEIDDKKGQLEIKDDGKVTEKTTGYEVKDETGKTVAKGDNEEDLLKGYIELDKNYYFKDGTIAYKKGALVNKEQFDKVKHVLITDLKDVVKAESTTTETVGTTTTSKQQTTTTTSKQQTTTTTSKQQTTTTIDRGTINQDGTFTIAGITFINKETYEIVCSGDYNEEDLRYNEDGILYIKTNQKTR